MGGVGGGLNPGGPWKTWKLWGWVSALRKFTLVGVLAGMSRLDLLKATFTAVREKGPEGDAPPPPLAAPPAPACAPPAAGCSLIFINLAAAAPPRPSGSAATALHSKATASQM